MDTKNSRVGLTVATLMRLTFAAAQIRAEQTRGASMRDIRGDLQERANLCQEQIKATVAHFDQRMQQLQNELDTRLEELKTTLAMIDKLMQFEGRLTDNVVTLESPAPRTSLADRIKAAAG